MIVGWVIVGWPLAGALLGWRSCCWRSEPAASPRNLPIIAMTANATVQDRERCLACGMNDHVGKPIEPQVLRAAGRLTAEEFEIMKTHTTLGFESIAQAEERLGSSVEFLRYAKEIALSHQEKWDGSGYPQARSGEDIPLSARLMAVADVYDALISRRVYKPPFSQEKSIALMREGRASHFVIGRQLSPIWRAVAFLMTSSIALA